MILKNFTSAAIVAALMTSFAVAQPSITVDLVRDGSGTAQLSAAGNWQWVVTVNQATIADLAGDGFGDSLYFGGGVSLTGSNLVAGSTISSVEQAGGSLADGSPGAPFLDTDLFDVLLPGDIVFGFEDPATSGLPGGGLNDAFPVGIIENAALDSVFVALGSDRVGGAAGSAGQSVPAFFFETVGPSTLGSLSSTATIVNGQVAQAVETPGTNGFPSDTFAVTGAFTATAVPGDANFDGIINVDDLALFGGGVFNSAVTGGFAAGDFDGNGLINVDDLAFFGGGVFNSSVAAPLLGGAPVPEPTSGLLLLAATAVGCVARRR